MESLSWTVHRARESPRKTILASVLILAFIAFSWGVSGPVLGILAIVVLFLALNTYFLPVTYTFTDKGVEVDKRIFTARYEWKQFRRWFRTTGGIVISPFSRKSYLDNFRGVHLLLPASSSRVPNDECRVTNDGQQTRDAVRTDDGRRTTEGGGLRTEERRTRNEERQTTAVQTADIVAYLEKRFAPPPPDERLKLDDALPEQRVESRES